MKTSHTRRLAAIMFTDIVGYTALMQRDEQLAATVRSKHRKVFEELHQSFHGEIIQYFGDGTLSVFQSGVEAVDCAIHIQQALQDGEPKIPLRIGLHIGDIVYDGTEIYGDGVNLASRIESMGVEGAILLTSNLNIELKNHSQISTQSLGNFSLKNIANPVEVFAVSNKGIRVPKRAEMGGKQQGLDKTIAVLPLVNMSSSEENEYFTDGMTEEIINALAKIKGLKVTSRTSSFFFKNKNIPIKQVGQELNVAIILEGSIRLAGNKMRLTAQLIDVKEDFHFWSETFDRSIDDIFAVQDEISLLIADKLREHIGHFDIEEQLVEDQEIPIDTYKLYLKSRYLILKMRPEDLKEGISILEGIISQYPHFALAHLGIHLAYTIIGTIGLLPAAEVFAKGQPYLNKAIELNPNLPESQLNLAYIKFLQDWDLPKAYLHLQKSFEIRPSVEYYQSMASILVAERKFEAATNYIQTAIQLDPFSNINYHLHGFILYGQEKYQQAQIFFEKSSSLNPHFNASILYLGQTFILSGQPQKALNLFQGLPEGTGDLLKLGGSTLTYAAIKDQEKISEGIAQLESYLQTDLLERAISMLVMCHALLGNEEKVISLMEMGMTYRLPMMVYYYTDPILKPLYSNPRFQTLMTKILGETTSFEFSSRKYKQALFTETELEGYKNKLQEIMETQQPYLNPDLSLRDLAQLLSIPPNHLSQLLNEGFDQNFSAFVNTYRLEAFKAKVDDPSQRHLTILALAYESGFNSKTVFNTFFKKTMGMTPRTYWKSIVG